MKRYRKLGTKISVMFVAFSILLGLFISIFTYMMSYRIVTQAFSEKGQEVAAMVSTYVDGDRITKYLKTMETDEYYDELYEKICMVKEKMGVEYLYIFEPSSDHLTFVMEAQTPTDDLEYISPMGTTYDYTDLEYTYLVPDIANKAASNQVILSTDNLYYGNAVSTWCPVLDSNGDLAAFVEADFSLDAVLATIRSNLITMLLVYIGLIILMITVLSLAMRKMVSVPLTKLTGRALRFASEGELSAFEDDIKTKDEMQALSEAFGKMAEDIDSYTKTQASVIADKERISTELEVASGMQMSMLPKELPNFAGRGAFDITGFIKPTADMGGDFYDYFVLEDRWVCAVICDVDAKGMQAAMLLVVAKTIIKSQMQTGDDLSEAMNAVNKQIYQAAENTVPVNAFVGVLDTVDGSFGYVNAGYNAPLIMRQGDRYEWLTSPAYAPLGVNENVSYRELTMRLHQNDRLVLYSNGLANARNRDGEAFGTDRIRKVLNAGRSMEYGLDGLVRNLYSEMEVFADGEENKSDVTVLALEYLKGDREKAQLMVRPQIERSQEVQSFLKSQMQENNIGGHAYVHILVMAEELFAVCCRRTSPGSGVTVRCEIPTGSNRVTISFSADMGGVDPIGGETDAASANAIAFIRKTADTLSYDRHENEDVITVTKKAD